MRTNNAEKKKENIVNTIGHCAHHARTINSPFKSKTGES